MGGVQAQNSPGPPPKGRRYLCLMVAGAENILGPTPQHNATHSSIIGTVCPVCPSTFIPPRLSAVQEIRGPGHRAADSTAGGRPSGGPVIREGRRRRPATQGARRGRRLRGGGGRGRRGRRWRGGGGRRAGGGGGGTHWWAGAQRCTAARSRTPRGRRSPLLAGTQRDRGRSPLAQRRGGPSLLAFGTSTTKSQPVTALTTAPEKDRSLWESKHTEQKTLFCFICLFTHLYYIRTFFCSV